MAEPDPVPQTPWPERSWLLGLLGAVVGIAFYTLVDPNHRIDPPHTAGSYASGFGLLAAGIALAFTLERARPLAGIAFAALAGLIVAFTFYWNVDPARYDGWEVMRVFCAVAAIGIAAPLFLSWAQAGMPRRGLAQMFPVNSVHEKAWTCAVIWIVSWAFAVLVILLTVLIGSLFNLIGFNFIFTFLEHGWFPAGLIGGAFGVAAGILRDRQSILNTLQGLLRTIFSVLSPVVGVALAFFVLASLFTGLSNLWEDTKATTPILLASFGLAFVLANAVIGDGPEDEAKIGVVRFGGITLAAILLPIALVAAISTGVRINQHGLSPDRIWALICTAVACAIGLAYLVSLIRGRAGWPQAVRSSNVRLGIGLSALALFLAMPFISFTSISAANQEARLNAGITKAADFSWDAMRFEYGEPGRDVLKRLAKGSTDADVRRRASLALAKTEETRFGDNPAASEADAIANIASKLIIKPTKVPLPDNLVFRLSALDPCGDGKGCMLLYQPGQSEAVLIERNCKNCPSLPSLFRLKGAQWSAVEPPFGRSGPPVDPFSGGKVELRDVTKRQIFVDNVPVGEPLEK